MKILITGAPGHIGSGLIQSIRPGEFDEVVLLDNLSTQRYCSLFNLPRNVPFRFIEADIRTADLSALFQGMDAVVHLAALTDAANSLERRDEVMDINLNGTYRVAEACRENHCRLFFPSTTSVYGVQEGLVDETCRNLAPQSPYAESKLAAEGHLLEMRTKGLQVVICRLGTIFGPSVGMRFHTAVNKFIWQAVTGQPLTVWTTALNQKRPYLDLQDAIHAIRFFLASPELNEPLYNVVTVNSTVQNILNILQKHINKMEVQLTDSPIMNQLSYEICAKRFASAGFVVRGDLERGIADTVEYLKGVAGC
jgi:nucleoside-diphosphate-sugar epimerase